MRLGSNPITHSPKSRHPPIHPPNDFSLAADYEYDFYGYADYHGGYAAEPPFYEDFYRSYEGGGEYFYEYTPGSGAGVGLSPSTVAAATAAAAAATGNLVVDCGGVGASAALQRSSRPNANAVGFVQQYV